MQINPCSPKLPPAGQHRRTDFTSLRRKLLLTIAIWVLCVLSFVSITVSITWRLEDRGTEINRLGQLSQHVYRLVAIASRPQPDQKAMATQQQAMRQLWAQFMQQIQAPPNPTLNAQISNRLHVLTTATIPISPPILMRQADLLAADIDRHTQQIEAANTRSISLLRIIRLCLIVLIIGSALTGFFLLKHWVLRPLAALNLGIRRIGAGDLAARVQWHTHDEFAIAADGFNQMAENLQDIYAHLEDKVSTKTQELCQQKQHWKTLYQVTAYLHQTNFDHGVLRYFLNSIANMSGACGACANLSATDTNRYGDAVGITKSVQQQLQQLHSNDSLICESNTDTARYLDANGQVVSTPTDILLLPAQYLKQVHGIVALQFRQPCAHTHTERQMWRLLCTQLAISWQNARWVVRQQQLAVLEERNLIAQGLHDSIAQSLSFLKIQFQILHKHPNLPTDSHLRQNITLIQNGLEHCYDDVRELLHNFRTRIHNQSFGEAIRNAVARHGQQTTLPIKLQMSDAEPCLPETQQIQVLFILQEALSNIRKHARAAHACVTVSNQQDFVLQIEDDGCGFDYGHFVQNTENNQHIGLSIMQERAQKICAQLEIHSVPNQGTRIRLALAHTQR